MDERADNERSVRNGRFTYIRNYMPFASRGAMLNYLWKCWQHNSGFAENKGNTNEITSRFLSQRLILKNSMMWAQIPIILTTSLIILSLKLLLHKCAALRTSQEKYYDAGLLPEYEMLRLAENIKRLCTSSAIQSNLSFQLVSMPLMWPWNETQLI